MDTRKLKEILAAHADQLLNEQAINPEYLELLSDSDDDELAPLFNVAERVKSTLLPVAPPHDFEEELKRQLLTTAHLRRAEGYRPPHPFRDLFVFLLSLAFVFSLAGALLVMWNKRQAS
jgi:hypothetical protein